MNKAYLYLYRRDAGSSIRSRPQPNGQAGRCRGGTPGRCVGEPPKRLLKIFTNVIFSILIFFSAARMSVCAAAPSPCLPPEKSANFVLKFRLIAEASNSRNVHPVFVTFRRFDFSTIRRNGGKTFRRESVFGGKTFRRQSVFGGKTFRRQSVSAAKRFGGKAFRRQRFSPFRLHVVIGSDRLCGATRDSADRRPTLDAESPKRAKRAKRVSKTGPVQNRNIPSVPRGATKNVPRGTPAKY